MKKYEITWFRDFSCLCGNCPQTCCKGWVIPLSGQDCDRFSREKGILGIRLFLATGGWTAGKFNPGSKACPFYGRDGLCALQKKKGHEYIPWTCQSYPRFYRNYGTFEECCLDLSCIGAARLFIRNGGTLEMTESEGDPCTQICTTNEDEDYLQFLLANRRQITDMARQSVSGYFTDILFLYAIRCQDHFSAGKSAGNDIPDFDTFYSDRSDHIPKDLFSFPLPDAVVTGILNSSLNHPRLRKVAPGLYSMFSKASAYLRSVNKPGSGWQHEAEDLLFNDPFVRTVLGNYLAYYMHQYYLRAYETYSFRKITALGLCHMNMVLLLVMVMKKAGSEKTMEDMMSEVIAAYNRRAYFNDDILDEIYRVYEDHYKTFRQKVGVS